MRHTTTPLAEQIDRLFRSFRELRRRPIWRSNVTAAAGFPEVKIGRDGLWHVHLHIIVQGRYIDQRDLGATWHAVTGDSYVVDVRAVRDEEDAAAYVTKYVTKPVAADVYRDADRLQEAITALRGRKLANMYGDWRGVRLKASADADAPDLFRPIAPLRAIASGDAADCDRWREVVIRRWPHLAAMMSRPPPSDDPGPF